MTELGRRIRSTLPWSQDVKMAYELLSRHKPRSIRCVCCHGRSKFRLAGAPPRHNAMCPKCGSLERHRQLVLLLRRRPDIIAGKSLLHFAPEPTLRPIVEDMATDYIGADLDPARGDRQINIEAMDLENESVEAIICNHVMEHVDDQQALSEMHRVLKPGGHALLTFPIIEGWATTYEDPAIVSEEDRLVHFGQEDHVRYYGRDVRERITEAGFALEEFTAVEPDVNENGLIAGETIFIAHKPDS